MRRVVSADSRSTREPGHCRGVVAASRTAGNPEAVLVLGFKGKRPMTSAHRVFTSLVALVTAGAFAAATASADTLYIGEGTDNAIQGFNAFGNPLGAFIPASPTGATEPRGILHLRNGNFLVAHQNPGLPVNGEIDEFATTGAFLRALVRSWSRITQALRINTPAALWLERGLPSPRPGRRFITDVARARRT